MSNLMTIDQVGMPPAPVVDQARTRMLANGALVTLTSTGVGISHIFRIRWHPSIDTTSVNSLVQTVDPKVWTFSPTPNVYGSWRIELDVDGEPVTRIFGIRTPRKGYLIPAFNENADRNASLFTNGVAQTAAAENNEPHELNAALTYTGWWAAEEQRILDLDNAGGSTDITTVFTTADSPVTAAYNSTIRVDPDAGEVIVELPASAGGIGNPVEIASVGALENPPLIRVQTQAGEPFPGGEEERTLNTKEEVLVARSSGAGWLAVVG